MSYKSRQKCNASRDLEILFVGLKFSFALKRFFNHIIMEENSYSTGFWLDRDVNKDQEKEKGVKVKQGKLCEAPSAAP